VSAHLADRGSRPVQPFPADDRPYRGVTREPFGVVDVLVAGEATVDRLAQESEQPMADVLAASTFGEGRGARCSQAEGVVQLAVGKQAGVGGNPDAVELELQATVEGDPQGRLFGFTRRVRHPGPAPPPLSF
jgi:hypothetical protein